MSLPAARAVECTELSASPSSRESLRRLQWCTCVSASARQSRAQFCAREFCCKILSSDHGDPQAVFRPESPRKSPVSARDAPAPRRPPEVACGCAAVRARQEGSHAPLEPVGTRPFDAHGTLARRAGSGRHARRQSRGPWAAPEAETVHAGGLRGLACKRARLQSRPFRRGGVSAWSSAVGRSARRP